MTPAARLSAAILVLDAIAAGRRAEAVLTDWARGARYAGSGDRAAVRDLVFDGLRRWRSSAALGGAETGRGRVLGLVRAAGQDPAALFTGTAHAPAPLTPAETAHLAGPAAMPETVALDCPDWLAPALRASLGAQFAAVMAALQHRAPVVLRVNLSRCSRAEAQARLAAEGIPTEFTHHASTALQVAGNARKIQGSESFAAGWIELQDSASQAVVEALPLAPGARVLDLCAGAGGKALALAARGATVFVHDAAPRRMADLAPRAARAGARITPLETPETAAPFDLVLADVPCSGSGSWRRDPEGKWRLTPRRLAELTALQAAILDRGAAMLAPGGWLALATCSLLAAENEAAAAAFAARHPGLQPGPTRRWSPAEGTDGFFLALFRRDPDET